MSTTVLFNWRNNYESLKLDKRLEKRVVVMGWKQA